MLIARRVRGECRSLNWRRLERAGCGLWIVDGAATTADRLAATATTTTTTTTTAANSTRSRVRFPLYDYVWLQWILWMLCFSLWMLWLVGREAKINGTKRGRGLKKTTTSFDRVIVFMMIVKSYDRL
ncbi:hypothetical protein ACLKA6_015771 [Drosophila palustris]